MTQPLRSLLITSIGNPGRLRKTRHSAGHLLLDAITPLLRSHLPPVYRTWQSPSYMNISGAKLVRQLEQFKQSDQVQHQTSALTLVILHDELEKPPGKIVVRLGGPEKYSLRGHNGLKDIFSQLQKRKMYPHDSTLSVLRIGIGIGRPESRQPDDVSKYVLSPMEGRELDTVDNAAGFAVKALINEVERAEGNPAKASNDIEV